jgi:hypothetical protein
MMTLDELFAGYEATAYAKAKAEIAAEQAAFDALPEAEKARIAAERDARAAAVADAIDADEAAAAEEDEDEDEDSDNDE